MNTSTSMVLQCGLSGVSSAAIPVRPFCQHPPSYMSIVQTFCNFLKKSGEAADLLALVSQLSHEISLSL